MSVWVCFSVAIYLESNWKMHPDVFLQVWLWEWNYKIDSRWVEIVYFCNFKKNPYADHVNNGWICLPITVAPLLHATVCAKARFMIQQSSIWLTLFFEILDCLYWLHNFRKIFVMNYRPMNSLFVVRDLLLHIINGIQFITLFHCLFEIETLAGAYVGWVKELMYFVECTIVQLIYFMKPFHSLLCKSRVWACLVIWNCNIRCKRK